MAACGRGERRVDSEYNGRGPRDRHFEKGPETGIRSVLPLTRGGRRPNSWERFGPKPRKTGSRGTRRPCACDKRARKGQHIYDRDTRKTDHLIPMRILL